MFEAIMFEAGCLEAEGMDSGITGRSLNLIFNQLLKLFLLRAWHLETTGTGKIQTLSPQAEAWTSYIEHPVQAAQDVNSYAVIQTGQMQAQC